MHTKIHIYEFAILVIATGSILAVTSGSVNFANAASNRPPSSNLNANPNPSSDFNSTPNPSSDFNSTPNSMANASAALTLNDFNHCVQQKAFNGGHLALNDVASCYSEVFVNTVRPSNADSSVNNSSR